MIAGWMRTGWYHLEVKMNKYLEVALGTPEALVWMLAQAGSDEMHLIMDRRSTASLMLRLCIREPSTAVKKRTYRHLNWLLLCCPIRESMALYRPKAPTRFLALPFVWLACPDCFSHSPNWADMYCACLWAASFSRCATWQHYQRIAQKARAESSLVGFMFRALQVKLHWFFCKVVQMQGPDIWDKLVSLENRRRSLGLSCFFVCLFF